MKVLDGQRGCVVTWGIWVGVRGGQGDMLLVEVSELGSICWRHQGSGTRCTEERLLFQGSERDGWTG